MILEVKNLEKSYRDGDRELHVLRRLNFELDQGQTVAIMGPSGCGKSTLISCLAGLTRSDAGSIRLGQNELTELSTNELTKKRAQEIGVVFQQFHLVPHLTAVENTRLPLDFKGASNAEAKKLAEQALALVGLADRADHYPHQLSRGECQRVAIARVLVNAPKLVLADEPTASLDRKTGKEIIQLLVDLSKKKNVALIVVTHDQEMAAACDQRYYFVDGQLRNTP